MKNLRIIENIASWDLYNLESVIKQSQEDLGFTLIDFDKARILDLMLGEYFEMPVILFRNLNTGDDVVLYKENGYKLGYYEQIE